MPGIEGGSRHADLVLSPAVDLLVNPNVADPSALAELGRKQLELAQRAHNALHAPARDGGEGEFSLFEFYDKEGVGGINLGFEALRRLAGERTFGGFRLVHAGERITHMRPYLGLVVRDMVACSTFNFNHDLAAHAPGAESATRPVRSTLKAGAIVGLQRSGKAQNDIGKNIDHSFSHIRDMSRAPGPANTDRLASELLELKENADLSDISEETVLAIARDQGDFLVELKLLFFDPGSREQGVIRLNPYLYTGPPSSLVA